MKNRTAMRWTNKEINLAKEALKLANGNQLKAAQMLTGVINRTPASIQIRMCILAKKHPSLRKKNILRRAAENKPVVETPQTEPITTTFENTAPTSNGTMVITRIELATDHLKFYF